MRRSATKMRRKMRKASLAAASMLDLGLHRATDVVGGISGLEGKRGAGLTHHILIQCTRVYRFSERIAAGDCVSTA
jgi:hypothetical protein